MWVTELLAKKGAIALLVVFAFFVLVLLNRQQTVVKLQIENKTLQDRIAMQTVSIQNPAVVKEGKVVVRTVIKQVNLTEEEKKVIADNYQMTIDELNRIVDSFQERTITVIKDGKEVKIPVFPSAGENQKPIVIDDKKRIAFVGLGTDLVQVGVQFKLIDKWNLWAGGNAVSDFNGKMKLGIIAGMGF